MASNNKSFVNDIGAFIDRVRGTDRLRKGDGQITVLPTPSSPQERETTRKIEAIAQYVRNKNWNRNHLEYYDEFRRMTTTFPIIKGAIDIYAEEITSQDTNGRVFNIECDNKLIKTQLEECFFKNLNMNSRAYLINREICKFGNVYAYLVTRPKAGVVDLVFLPPETMVREQMFNPKNLEEYRFTWYGGANSIFSPWEIVHWKNTEDIEMEPYGTSILRPIIDTWRRVVLIREALVIYRITRAPQKFLFKVGTDGMTGEEAFKFAQDLKKEITRKPLVNPETGEIDFKYNPMSIEENFFMPTYEGSPSDVTVLEGASNLDQVEDYKIIKDDLFAGLKIPKSWLTFEEDLSNKSALSEEDVRFAKTIQKHQGQFVEGLVQIGLVHLYLNGASKEDLESFKIVMNNPSTVSEKKKIELVQARMDLAKSAWDYNNPGLNLMSYTGVLKNILKFTDEEIKETIKDQLIEKKLMWRMTQLATSGFYEEPDPEKRRNLLKQMAGDDKEMKGFDNLMFESGTSVGDIVKRKIDEEIAQLFPKLEGKADTKQIRVITESLGPMVANLTSFKKRL